MDNRYFFEKADKDYVTITGQEFVHLTKVRRACIKDSINAFCLDGYDYSLTIERIEKSQAVCRIEDKTLNKANNRPNITVYLASIKQDALKEALDNLTQLNIKEIRVFESVYSNAKYTNDKIDKLKNNLIQFAKQCERAEIPNIRFVTFKEMVEELKSNDINIFAYENAKENFLTLNVSEYKDKKISLIVGGEGGFEPSEVEQLDRLAKRVSMGKTILRAPVAVTSLVAVVMSSLGEWQR